MLNQLTENGYKALKRRAFDLLPNIGILQKHHWYWSGMVFVVLLLQRFKSKKI